MNTIIEKTVNGAGALNCKRFMVERFDSANEVVAVSSRRQITDSRFSDERAPGRQNPSWTGVKSFDEACELMRTGYQPTVEKLKDVKVSVSGDGKRVSFFNDIVGYAPVVPLAMMGVPTSMINSRMTPMKAKVINVYYDMTAGCGTDKEKIIEAGQKLLGAIMELEMQGYRFNLYAIQSYSENGNADILCTKIKDSHTPLDLKRISFPLTHTAYFRVIGFDWYTRTPKGTYRGGYGRGLSYGYSQEDIKAAFEDVFNEKCVYFSCVKIMNDSQEHLKGVLTSNDK